MGDKEEKKHGVQLLIVMKNHFVETKSIPLRCLKSSSTAYGALKVRAVFHARMLKKAADLKGGYMPNQPMSVRANDDETFTIFDGNHRYEAINYLIAHGAQNQPYTEDTMIPCVVYSSSLPAQVAMKFATLTNELQLCAAGGTALDFLRFLLNLSRERITEGDTPTVKSIYETFTHMFGDAGVDMPKFATYRYTTRAIHFLTFLVGPVPPLMATGETDYGKGFNAFNDAEELQDLDAPDIRLIIFAAAKLFSVKIDRSELDPMVLDQETFLTVAFTKKLHQKVSPTSFLHPNITSFDTKGLATLGFPEISKTCPNIPKDVVPGILYIRMLWAHWIVSGGIPADKAKCLDICNDLTAHLQAWDRYIVQDKAKVKLHGDYEDELPGGSAEKYLETLDPKIQEQLMAEVTVKAVLADDWPEVAETVATRLLLVKKDVIAFGRQTCKHSMDFVNQDFKPIQERPVAEVAWFDMRRCSDMLADLKDFIPRWREEASGETSDFKEPEFKAGHRIKTAGGVLMFMSALHLLQKPGVGGGSTAVVADLHDLKKKMMDDWHVKWEENAGDGKKIEDYPKTVQGGLSFTGIDSDISNGLRVVTKAEIAANTLKVLNAMKTKARASRAIQIRRLKQEAEDSRKLEREAAIVRETKQHGDREIKAENNAQEVQRNWDAKFADLDLFGMPTNRYRVLGIPPLKAKLLAVPEPEYEKQPPCVVAYLMNLKEPDDMARAFMAVYRGGQNARIYFIDVENTKSDLEELAAELKDIVMHFKDTTDALGGFKGKISILCKPSHQSAAYRALTSNGFVDFDASQYTAGVGEDAYTLADKAGVNNQGEEDWDVHANLLPHPGETCYTRTLAPMFLIISAGTAQQLPCADRDVFKTGATYRRDILSQIVAPNWTSTVATKYRYEFNMSKHWSTSEKYPKEFALANFFFWHLREGDSIVVRGSLRTGLVARCLGHPVFFVTTLAKEAFAIKAFKDLSLLADPLIIGEYFKGYKPYEHLMTVVQWCMEARKAQLFDAYQLLLQQPLTINERFKRSEFFWTEAFKGTKCRPFIVGHPTRYCALFICPL